MEKDMFDLYKTNQPFTIMFFRNGTAAVCDINGYQLTQFQEKHQVSIYLLKEAGVDWRTLPDIIGHPQ